MIMNKAERDKARGDNEFGFEEGYYFEIVHAFCDFLTDAYNDGPDGKKYEHLMEVLKEKLPSDVFEEVFVGFEPKTERVKRSPIYGYPEIGKYYGDGFYTRRIKEVE